MKCEKSDVINAGLFVGDLLKNIEMALYPTPEETEQSRKIVIVIVHAYINHIYVGHAIQRKEPSWVN